MVLVCYVVSYVSACRELISVEIIDELDIVCINDGLMDVRSCWRHRDQLGGCKRGGFIDRCAPGTIVPIRNFVTKDMLILDVQAYEKVAVCLRDMLLSQWSATELVSPPLILEVQRREIQWSELKASRTCP